MNESCPSANEPNGHIYNLRKSRIYSAGRLALRKTRPPRRLHRGPCRKPLPDGKPGFLHIDTVRIGNRSGKKGFQPKALPRYTRLTRLHAIPILVLVGSRRERKKRNDQSTIHRHPLSSLCGDMDAETFKALVNDIREQGQLEPIDLVCDEIVDGWHRYRACQLLELEPKTRVLPDSVELVEYVLGKNAHRRHMTAEQRAAVVMLAAKWMPAHRPAAKGKGDTVSPLSNEAAAQRAGVSKRTIQRVKAQIRAGYGEALATGSETLRSLAAKARKAAVTPARENSGKVAGEQRKERGKVAELRDQVAFLKTEIERRDARITELIEEVERLTLDPKQA